MSESVADEVDLGIAELFDDDEAGVADGTPPPPLPPGLLLPGDTPMSQWSSLLMEVPTANVKRLLAAEGQYFEGSGEMCTAYVTLSDSAVLQHPYYCYPAVLDPGIREALLEPDSPLVYDDDGQELYLKLCAEMRQCPVRIFHRGLLDQRINLSYYGVDPAAVRTMCLALARNKTVQALDLTDNWLSGDGSYHLGRLLLENSTLTDLNLYGCRLGLEGILRLCDTLVFNRTLVSLNLGRNQLGDDGVEIFAQALTDSASVVRLNLSHNSLTGRSAQVLNAALEFNNKLTHLDLSWNKLYGPPGMGGLLSRLSNSKTLVELKLAWNALGDKRIAIAIRNLMTVPTLQHIDISNNKFGHDAIDPLVQWLFKAKKLHTLNLSNNPLEPGDAVKALSKLMLSRVKIQNLYLDNVCVNREFMELLATVRQLRYRRNAVVTYGTLRPQHDVSGPDIRELLLRRANFLALKPKKRRVDLPVFLLSLYKAFPEPIAPKQLMMLIKSEGATLDDDLMEGLSLAFPGPRPAKGPRPIDLAALTEYVRRMWPDARPPPTPPPTPPPPPPEPKGKKGKKGKGKGKK